MQFLHQYFEVITILNSEYFYVICNFKKMRSIKKIEGKVALVTGETTGIGQAAAIAFSRQGATVITTGLSKDEGQETVRLIEETGSEGWFLNIVTMG